MQSAIIQSVRAAQILQTKNIINFYEMMNKCSLAQRVKYIYLFEIFH